MNAELHHFCLVIESCIMKSRISILLKHTKNKIEKEKERDEEKENIALTSCLIPGLAPLESKKVAMSA